MYGAPPVPTEPPQTTVAFPDDGAPDEHGIVFDGGDLEPGTILAAYRRGLFPMRRSSGVLAWFSPDPRGVLRPGDLRITKSLRRSVRDFELTVDTTFDEVVAACADRAEGEFAWITDDVRAAYGELHRLGWAHSVEAWVVEGEQRVLAGGLYGLALGGLFAGESMFHRRRDASKAALVGLADRMAAAPAGTERIVDLQWLTPHLASLGGKEIGREEYQATLDLALGLDDLVW